MTFADNIKTMVSRAAEEFKSLRTLINGNQPNLSALTTTDKTNLVAAINEVAGSSGGGLKIYANTAELDAETETVVGIVAPSTNWGAYTGITSPSARSLTNYAGSALVQTVYGTRSSAVAKTQFLLLGDNQTSDTSPIRRLVRRGDQFGWSAWRYDNLVPFPLTFGEIASKGYADSVGNTILSDGWAGLNNLSQNNTVMGLVLDNGFNLGAATGIAKYNGWLGGQLRFVSNATYSAGDVTAQVQQVWIPNLDGTLDEIRRTRSGGGAWSAWVIHT